MAALLLLLVASVAHCHVSLVFPPARRLDLDFLDSDRTKAPCGMPKGKKERKKEGRKERERKRKKERRKERKRERERKKERETYFA